MIEYDQRKLPLKELLVKLLRAEKELPVVSLYPTRIVSEQDQRRAMHYQ